jgi:hypothetical protein
MAMGRQLAQTGQTGPQEQMEQKAHQILRQLCWMLRERLR